MVILVSKFFRLFHISEIFRAVSLSHDEREEPCGLGVRRASKVLFWDCSSRDWLLLGAGAPGAELLDSLHQELKTLL
jgi:hypothetical protein